MKIFTTPSLALAAAVLLVGTPACAQVYSWKDPDTGQTRLSNIPPPWYSSREERVSGPRVIKTYNGKVADDTALPYEDRLLLSGKSRDDIEKLRVQKNPETRAQRDPVRESAKPNAESAGGQAADMTPPQGTTAKKNKG